jgi:tetratricopeptide (TPR) repeat protein
LGVRITFGKRQFMNILRCFYRIGAPLCGALLLCFGLAAHADDTQDAYKLFKQGRYTPALEKVNAVLADKPKDAQARFLKGLIFTEQGKSDDAIGIFSSLTDDYPDQPEPYNNLAVLYAGQGKYDKARAALEMAIRNHPSYPTAHENMGDIYAKMASQEYERAQQLDPTNPSPQAKLAVIRKLFPKNIARKPDAPDAAVALPQTAPASAPVAAPAAKP